MDFKVTISRNAEVELEEILTYIARDNPDAGLALYNELRRSALSLRQLPLRNLAVLSRRNIRRMLAHPYWIYYRISESKRRVEIVHFWHSARQPPFV
jgi:plasmid stabilization system protein ParE